MKLVRTSSAYREGDYFAVPLPSGGYAIGLVARCRDSKGPAAKVLLGYFFGPRLRQPLTLEATAKFRYTEALLICRFADLGLRTGEWSVIGQAPNWDKTDWPMPDFFRQQLVSNTRLKVTYADDDPGKVLTETETWGDISQRPKDGLFGSRAIENYLDEQLEKMQ